MDACTRRPTILIRALSIVLLILTGPATAANAIVERPDWGAFFAQAGATGTLVVVDERQTPATTWVYNRERSVQRYSPASTYKIAHTLLALDAGAARDEFQVFKWDGVKHGFEGHNQDQTLRSAMRYSTLWVYQRFADQIGQAKARAYLQRVGYGNADPSTPKGTYWVDGALRISAMEQIDFLRRLYRNTLPFKVEHQRLVKDLIIKEARADWILRAKTGWEGRYGWWVGWVEAPEGAVFFALNIDTPHRLEDLPKRELITRAVLNSLNLLQDD